MGRSFLTGRVPLPDTFLFLAIGLWLLAACSLFAADVGAQAEPLIPIFWMASGLALTRAVHVVLRRMEGQPLHRRLPAVGFALVCASLVQAEVGAWGPHLASVLEGAFPGGAAPVESGPAGASLLAHAASRFSDSLWVFGFYALSATLLALEGDRERARSLASQADLEALRGQLNPHFVFNALNALSTLILMKRVGEADAATMALSDFLRRSLQYDRTARVTLSEELVLVQRYLEIENIRFPDRIALSLEIPPALASALVPGTLVQSLVERAVEHATPPPAGGVTIHIAARRRMSGLELVVAAEDLSRLADRACFGSGRDLESVRARLRLAYGKTATLLTETGPGGFRATVRAPLADGRF